MAERLAGIGHWRFDIEDAKFTWSDRMFVIHGMDRKPGGPELGRLLKLYHPDERGRVMALVDRALKTGQGYSVESRIVLPSGETRFIAATAECLKDQDGAVTALIGVLRDITETRRAEHLLRALEDHRPGMIAYWDRDLKCQFANQQYIEWFGRSSDEMLGLALPDLLGPELFVRNRPLYIILANARTSPHSLQYETTYQPDSSLNPLLPIVRYKFVAGFLPADWRIQTADAKQADDWRGTLDESKVVVLDLDRLTP